MNKQWRRVLAAALTVSLSVSALTACGKKDSSDTGLDTEAAYITMEGGSSMSAGTANLILRYQQAEMENGFGAFIKSYYGDIWNSDLTGTGEAYGDYFKEQLVHEMEHLLLAEAHMEELGLEITEDEEKAIENAAKQFMTDNADYTEALSRMSATEDTVKEMLRYYTIRSKVEAVISADVDTEVSDEEAAQRTVNYIYFTATVETEEETEVLSEEMTEELSEAAGESTAESVAATAEAETDVKTSSADETEGDESVAEAAEGVADEAATEAETEEAETESAEMLEARAVAQAKAEAFMASVQDAADAEAFELAADEAADADSTAYAGSETFGSEDTWPDAAIISATEGLDDNTLVDQVIVVGSNYYVVYVADAFDEEATEEEKENIVEQRISDAIEEQFEAWEEEAAFDVNGDISAQLLFDFALAEEEQTEELLEESTEDEFVIEFDTEEIFEDMSEQVSEAVGEGASESTAEIAG